MSPDLRMFPVLLCFIVTVTGCVEERLDYYNPDVKVFVKQLKSGSYKTEGPNGFVCVPEFKMVDIPDLLAHVDDLSAISDFPVPPVYSYLSNDLRLGEGILWVIETVRLGEWASLGCKLVYREADNYERRFFLTDEEVREVATAYKVWWENYSKLLEQILEGEVSLLEEELLFYLTVDPLAHTNYRWW